jgi:hypothetical protein
MLGGEQRAIACGLSSQLQAPVMMLVDGLRTLNHASLQARADREYAFPGRSDHRFEVTFRPMMRQLV